MGEKFKDFPCFYYLDGRVNKKNRLQFYSMLAAMFGQAPEEAAQTSELFAHASGKLFGGSGYTVDEIDRDCGSYFEKPYKDCRGFYRRKAFDESGLRDNCCVICPYSHFFLNNCIEQERQILRILSEHRDWFQIANCSTSDFRSRLAISCTNDISEYPAIPFHAYLFEFLLRNEELTADAVTAFISDTLSSSGQYVPDTILAPFVATQLGIISRTVMGGDDTSTLLFAVSIIREDRYTPPQLVQPQSQTMAKKEKKARPAANAIEELARLLSDIDNMHFVPEERKDATVVPAQAEIIPAPSTKTPHIDKETSPKPDMLDKLLDALNESVEDASTLAATPESVLFSEEDDNAESFAIEAEPAEESTGTQTANATVTITTLPDNSFAPEEEQADAATNAEESVVTPCDICYGTGMETVPLKEEWQESLYKHCILCEKAVSEGKEKSFHSVTTNHTPISSGCAFCPETYSIDCLYSDTPVTISEKFSSIIHDCSDYMGHLINLVAFMDACENASHISIECVKMHGIEGLLLYVGGAYYFIGGGASACAGLKQVFSNAEKHRIYSLNPLLVHEKLLRFGLRLTKIESLAVLYSVFVGTDILLPPGLFFVTEHGTDQYRTFMPQYDTLFSRITLTDVEKVRYEKLKRLEWALAASADTKYIATGMSRSIYGSNALNYRLALLAEERICREGILYVVTLDRKSELPAKEAVLFWEDVASRLAASSLSCMNYAFILGLGNGISYFTCFEEEAFFDSLMASARSAYRKTYKKEVHLQVVSERYCTLSCAVNRSEE